jgi:glucose 1-dehydrogenase
VQLENKVAAVTGSSLGIGRAIALAFAREGASVAINYRSHPEEGTTAVQEIEKGGSKAISVQADVSEPEGVKRLIQQTVKEFGRLDVMVNNAGIERKIPFLETPFEVWEKVISVNLTGVWLGCQEAASQMVSQGDGGRIIKTPINKNLDKHPEQRQALLSEIPLGKIGRPEDVASMAVYLASDASSYSTGSTFFVDGGMIRQAGSL